MRPRLARAALIALEAVGLFAGGMAVAVVLGLYR